MIWKSFQLPHLCSPRRRPDSQQDSLECLQPPAADRPELLRTGRCVRLGMQQGIHLHLHFFACTQDLACI